MRAIYGTPRMRRRDMAAGLEYLHQREPTVIHRDLKPDNVLLTDSNPDVAVAKITDFGLSKTYSRRSIMEQRQKQAESLQLLQQVGSSFGSREVPHASPLLVGSQMRSVPLAVSLGAAGTRSSCPTLRLFLAFPVLMPSVPSTTQSLFGDTHNPAFATPGTGGTNQAGGWPKSTQPASNNEKESSLGDTSRHAPPRKPKRSAAPSVVRSSGAPITRTRPPLRHRLAGPRRTDPHMPRT